jgi:hypothetical protein
VTLQELRQNGAQIQVTDFDGSRCITADDGKERIEYNGDGLNNQAILYPLGASKTALCSVGDLRRAAGPDATLYQIADRTAGRLTLKTSEGEVIVDELSGSVYRSSVYGTTGVPVRQEWLQDYFITYPGSIVFPSLRLQAYYRQPDSLCHLKVTWIEDAAFNIDLGVNAFAVPVPAKCNIFDRRDLKNAWNWTTGNPLADVVVATNEHFGPSPPGALDAGRGPFRWVAGSIALLLLVFCIGLWLRKQTRLS